MKTYCLIAFFLLFGIMELGVTTSIPHWVLGCISLATALVLIISAPWKNPPPG